MKRRSALWCLPALALVVCCATQAPATLAPAPVVAAPAVSAAPPDNKKEVPFEIQKVAFVYEDIHPSFWAGASRTDSMFLSVFISFKGAVPEKQHIKDIRIYDQSKRYWTMSKDEYVAAGRTYIGGYTRFRTDHYSLNWSVLSLAPYEIQITMNDGNVCRYKFDPCDPDADGRNCRQYVYSTDYAGRKDERFAQGLRRAVIKESRIEGDVVHVTFSIDDDRELNGEVVFYDQDKRYVGETAKFRNIHSLEVRRYLNGGATLNLDGAANTAKIASSDIVYAPGRSFADIAYVMVSLVCNDLEQEVDRDVTIFRSKSELVLTAGRKLGRSAPARPAPRNSTTFQPRMSKQVVQLSAGTGER